MWERSGYAGGEATGNVWKKGSGLLLNDNEGWHLYTLAMHQHLSMCFIYMMVGEGSCGHGRGEWWIKGRGSTG